MVSVSWLCGRPRRCLYAADTDMMARVDGPKVDPADVAKASRAGIEARSIQILVDDPSRFVKAARGEDPA